MKKPVSILILCSAAILASAQTNIPSTGSDTNSSVGSLLWNTFKPVLNATNYAVEPYGTYSTTLKKGGGGLFVAYNINDYVGAGVALDYLGQFTLVTGNLQLKYAIHPFSAYPNFAIVPFAMGGAGQGLSGASKSGIVTTDVGAYFQFGHLWGGTFNVGAAYGKWINADKYSGTRYHAFLGWNKGF